MTFLERIRIEKVLMNLKPVKMGKEGRLRNVRIGDTIRVFCKAPKYMDAIQKKTQAENGFVKMPRQGKYHVLEVKVSGDETCLGCAHPANHLKFLNITLDTLTVCEISVVVQGTMAFIRKQTILEKEQLHCLPDGRIICEAFVHSKSMLSYLNQWILNRDLLPPWTKRQQIPPSPKEVFPPNRGQVIWYNEALQAGKIAMSDGYASVRAKDISPTHPIATLHKGEWVTFKWVIHPKQADYRWWERKLKGVKRK